MRKILYKRIMYFHNGSLGDFLMTLHLCENIHASLPAVQLIIVVPRYESVCRELAEGYPYVLVVFANRHNALWNLFPFIFERNVCVTPPTPGRVPLTTKIVARILSLFGGGLVGFKDGTLSNKMLYSILLEYDVRKLYVETMHDIIKALNLPILVPDLSFSYKPVPPILKRYSIENGQYIVLHPFGSSETRSISVKNLTWLVNKITNVFSGLTVVITGSVKDREHYHSVLSDLEENKSCVVVAGELGMSELATVLSKAILYIGVDTGITHLASVLGKKSVVIAHTSSPPNWLPYYNPQAEILYHIQNDSNNVYEGREYLFKNFYKVRCLEMPPREIIYQKIVEVIR